MLTQERLKELLNYNPDTGIFTWLASSGNGTHAGAIAGSYDKDGYRKIAINRTGYRAHRLAWLFTFGVHPACQIDHINMDKEDNSILNLREATHSENLQNQFMPMRNSKSGLRGACWNVLAKKWKAKINVNHVEHYLGYFDTAEEAHQAYLSAKARLHPFAQSS